MGPMRHALESLLAQSSRSTKTNHQHPASLTFLRYTLSDCVALFRVMLIFFTLYHSGTRALGCFKCSIPGSYIRLNSLCRFNALVVSACAVAIPHAVISRGHLVTAAFSAPSIRRYSHVISRTSNHAVISPVSALTRTSHLFCGPSTIHPPSISYCFTHH